MNWRSSTAVLGLCLAATAAPAQDSGEIERRPHFTTTDHRLVLTVLDVSSRKDLADDGRSKHYLSFDGFLRPAREADAIAVAKDLRALRIYDSNGNEMLPAPARGRTTTRERPPEDFSAVLGDSGVTGLSKTQLVQVPWAMRSMDAEATLILGKARHDERIPATVMEDFASIAGVELRIDRLSMSADRKLTVSIQYRRAGAGPSGPFIEAVYAVNEDGNSLGGGRWTDGTPMKDKGKLSFVFPLDSSQTHHGFKIVICSDYDVQPVGFTLTELFDR